MKDVFSQTTFNDKANRLVEISSGKQIYGKDYLKLMLIALINRIKIILNTSIKISSISHSTATLLRPTTASVANISESYDLDVNFKEKVKVKFLDGNHFTILENPELLEIINQIHSELEALN